MLAKIKGILAKYILRKRIKLIRIRSYKIKKT